MTLSDQQIKPLLEKASQIHNKEFGNSAWFGKCIFLSWYCSNASCRFCYRSLQSEKVDPEKAKRTLASIIVEAMFCRHLNWQLEFLTGGYGIFPFEHLLTICKIVSAIVGEKIWLNIGEVKDKELEQLRSFVQGIVASIETVNPKVHKVVCPKKPVEPYSRMLKSLKGFKKSITIIVGLGETIDDFPLLEKFIKEHKLDKITFYALKPVRGTMFENNSGPESNYYAEWIARTRIAFPKLEIMAGITPKRAQDVKIILEAGANAVTKFSATKLFNSERARLFERLAKESGRVFKSRLSKLPNIDWDSEVDKLEVEEEVKIETKNLLRIYLKKMKKEGKK